jgi:hypothetical protein
LASRRDQGERIYVSQVSLSRRIRSGRLRGSTQRRRPSTPECHPPAPVAVLITGSGTLVQLVPGSQNCLKSKAHGVLVRADPENP